MTKFQLHALSNPLARADGCSQQRYRRIDMPWSIILTVNK
jgi:hypothetical protein